MRILITAGPTREYLDDVRYLSNASSGRMGYSLAAEALSRGHQVVLVSGPVEIAPPAECELVSVQTTDEMRLACEIAFANCDGVIAAAAVSDYKPRERISGKIAKTGGPMTIEMIETDDVLAGLGREKKNRWIVGFALEAANSRENALQKLRAKNCDVVVLNGPSAIGAADNSVELIDGSGEPIATWSGSKAEVARELIGWIETHLSGREAHEPDAQARADTQQNVNFIVPGERSPSLALRVREGNENPAKLQKVAECD